MNLSNLSFGQRLDNGLVQPWFTHGALDAISKMDLSDKVILEYGAGLGDVWLSRRCKELVIIERNYEWLGKVGGMIASNDRNNVTMLHRQCNDCDGQADYYTAIPNEPDVIINDDAYRFEVIVAAIAYAKKANKPITLIVDNWQQDYVFMCPSAEVLLKDYKQEIYPQADHTDHEGNCWKTAIFYL
jgi:hypothetical protein